MMTCSGHLNKRSISQSSNLQVLKDPRPAIFTTCHGDKAVLVEVVSTEASLCLQGLKSLCGCAVSVTPHGVLQQRKGVISSWDLSMDSEEDILDEVYQL